MKKIFFLLFLFFSLCQAKLAYSALKEQSLIYTKKHSINIGENMGVLIYTYINPVISKPLLKEFFILSIAPSFLKIKDFKINIQGEKATIKALDSDDKLLRLIATNKYSKYFLVSSQKLYKDNLLKSKLCVNKECFTLKIEKEVKALFFP